MLLAIDAGNSNVKFGVYDGETLFALWRIRTEAGRTVDEYTALLSPLFTEKRLSFDHITGIALASVAPSATPALLRLADDVFRQPPLQITADTDLGLRIDYRPPGDVGADRLADAVAAVHHYGAPCIVIDFGTATTFNAIAPAEAPGEKPVYLGGAICPGIELFLEGLPSRAAKLFPVELSRPPRAIGSNTVHALQSGLVFGYVAQVAGLVARFRAEMDAEDCPVIATGGHAAGLIAAESASITAVDPLLTLDGLRLVYDRNRPGS